MNDAFGVSDVESIGNLNPEIEDLFNRERLTVDVLAEGFAVDELHGDERAMILLANVVDGADAGMVESGSRVGFTAKTFESLGVLDHVIGKKFQGDGTVEAGVAGFVNHPHSAGAEFLNDAEVRDGLVNHGCPGFRMLRYRSQGLIVQGGITRRPLARRSWWLRGAEHAEDAGAFPVGGQVGLMVKLERDVLVADGADQCTVASAVLLEEHVVAHDALATNGHP